MQRLRKNFIQQGGGESRPVKGNIKFTSNDEWLIGVGRSIVIMNLFLDFAAGSIFRHMEADGFQFNRSGGEPNPA